MRQDTFQIWLITSGLLVCGLLGIFVYRELYPEYKIYQDDYIALEEFRSTYTHEPPTKFKTGVKQLVLEREDNGPPIIDRCTSCHVALQIPYFSPTKLGYDVNGNILRDEENKPVQVPNDDYIWNKLDQKIAALRDAKVNQQLTQEGNSSEVDKRLREADYYESLKTAHVGDYVYDVKKVLAMHPLIGKETRPFEYHPIEEYGCTSCHNGNGRGLVTDKAHGPVFEDQYEIEYEGPTPTFTEKDEKNDPEFSKVFNHKPGEELIFQTQPIFVGALIQSKCLQCHLTSAMQAENAIATSSQLSEKSNKQIKELFESFKKDKKSILALLELRKKLITNGYPTLLDNLKKRQEDYNLLESQIEQAASEEKYLKKFGSNQPGDKAAELALNGIDNDLQFYLGSQNLVKILQADFDKNGKFNLDNFIKAHQKDSDAKGTIFVKAETIDLQQDLIKHAEDVKSSLSSVLKDSRTMSSIHSDVDALTRNFQNGEYLYFSQACYACHRISGLTRGGVGPELTKIGNNYPWYIKKHIVWPQGDLKTSTMPNMRLDHKELENLMTFLLAQKGSNQAISQSGYKAELQSWEAGRKLPWEKPVSPAKIYDLNYAMTVFTTEGCAACHRLKGFESNVGFNIEKGKPAFDELYEEKMWFKRLFPETISVAAYDEQLPGSLIVARLEKNGPEIDQRIVGDIRKGSLLEEIEKNYPETIESFYSNFRYASRAKNLEYENLIKNEKDPEKKSQYVAELAAWKDRVHRVLMMYVQIYGLGRLIGPRPNWSGIFRTDEWLMEHFRNPSEHVPRSIMPVMPFDDTKFYALTNMLDVLAIRNRNESKKVWSHRGFDPKDVFETLCSQCHGMNRLGNGPVAEWIYPVPKNLHNPDFLRNLTKERAHFSILHGVKGTPMPPWGEFAKDKPANIQKMSQGQPILTEAEITTLVDWLFESLSGEEVIKEKGVPKWQYEPKNVLEEMRKEGEKLKGAFNSNPDQRPWEFPTGKGLYVSLNPKIYPENMPEPYQDSEVNEIFDAVKTPEGDPDPYHFYIKKKYYTPENIMQGKIFFEDNCAPCHGKEADGSGLRSEAMYEAKPRMLTNLDWINSRDDIRLLRSIKYGVPGTAMTPWGDFTNALQRMQLVIFIRNLTETQEKTEALKQLLYKAFDIPLLLVEKARISGSEQLNASLQERNALQEEVSKLENSSKEGENNAEELVKVYQKKINVEREIDKVRARDQEFLDLKSDIKKEKEIYYILGQSLIAKDFSEAMYNDLFEIIKLHEDDYSFSEGKLDFVLEAKKEERIKKLRKDVGELFDRKIDELQTQRKDLMSQVPSVKRYEGLKELDAEVTSYKKLKTKTMSDIEESLNLMRRQHEEVDHTNVDPNEVDLVSN